MALIDQILASGGDWNIQGIDRAKELEQILQANGITDLTQLKFNTDTAAGADLRATNGTKEPDPTYLTYGDRRIGTLAREGGDAAAYMGQYDEGRGGSNVFARSQAGHGGVTYQAMPNADGSVSVQPNWNSSSDASRVRKGVMVAGAPIAIGAAMGALGPAGLAGAGAEGAGAGGLGGFGAESLMTLPMSAEGATFGSAFPEAALGGATGGASAGGGVMGSLFGGGGGGSVLGSALNFGGNLLSGILGSNAAGNAADAQLAAGRESNALQKYMYDTTRTDFAPYRQAGTSALAGIQKLLADPSSVSSMPDYQFGLDQGTKSLNNGAAARGMTYSGQQGKALQRYGNDYAGTKLNDSYNRLASIAGIGQQATGSTANAGSQYATNAGNTLQGMGNASAAGTVGQSNAWTGAIGNALSNWQQQTLMDRYLGGGK